MAKVKFKYEVPIFYTYEYEINEDDFNGVIETLEYQSSDSGLRNMADTIYQGVKENLLSEIEKNIRVVSFTKT